MDQCPSVDLRRSCYVQSKLLPSIPTRMSRYMQYYISLNKSTLVFFPLSSKENSNGYVVQVMIKSKQ